MRVVDRVIAVIVAVIIIAVVSIVGLVPDSIRRIMASLEESSLLLRLVTVMVINILVVIGLLARLRGPRKVTTGLAVKAPGSQTDVSIESAQTLLLSAVEEVPDVVSAEAKVKAVNGKADIDLLVQVKGDDIHVPRKQKEINRALRQVINKQLGLQMQGRPRVHIRLADDLSNAWETPVSPDTQPLPELKAKSPVKTKVDAADEDTLVDKPEAGTNDDWLANHLAEKDKQSEI